MLKGICPNCELEIDIYEEIIECESCGSVMRVSKWKPLEIEEVSPRIATHNQAQSPNWSSASTWATPREEEQMTKMVIKPSGEWKYFIMGICIFLAVLFGMLGQGRFRDIPEAAWLISGLFGLGAATMLFYIVEDLPKTIVDEDGIQLLGLFKSWRWAWRDVGRFHVSAQRSIHATGTLDKYFACAFTNARQAAVDASGVLVTPNWTNADVVLDLLYSPPGASFAAASEFVAHLNAMRETHGASVLVEAHAALEMALVAVRRERRFRRLQELIVFTSLAATAITLVWLVYALLIKELRRP